MTDSESKEGGGIRQFAFEMSIVVVLAAALGYGLFSLWSEHPEYMKHLPQSRF